MRSKLRVGGGTEDNAVEPTIMIEPVPVVRPLRAKGFPTNRSMCLVGLLCLALQIGAAQAKTLRWAPKGDAQSMDPYASADGLTSNITALVYDSLVQRDREERIVPALALSWTLVDATTWRLALRRDARFQDGAPVTADDVVFSIERSQQPTSQFAVFTRRLGKAVAINAHTVELRLDAPNPILLEHLQNIYVMSRAWCVEHDVVRVPDFTLKEEAYSTRHAMGSGPFVLKERQPGVRTVHVRNPAWWGGFEGNVTEVVLTPIANDATRTAALLAGDIDFSQQAPPQDMPRFEKDPSVRLLSGRENRIIFFGFDQSRDELLYSSVKGKNPFKDVRVREAFFRAVDAEAIRVRIMRGQSTPTACMTTAPRGCLASALEVHPPADLERARRLMAEAGYAQGFGVTLDCPNDRYVNDQAICVALVPMLARIGITLTVTARPKSLHFPRIQSRDTSFYMLGWGGDTIDAQIVLDPLVHGFDASTQKGADNLGRFEDRELDHWIDAAATDIDADRRARLIRDALQRVFDRFYYLPLHRQMLTWVSRVNVHPVIQASNGVNLTWFRID